jgi:hypothetical protein
MRRRPNVAGPCDRCGKPIKFGNACVLVEKNIERFDGHSVTVEESNDLLRVCARCGNGLCVAPLGDELARASVTPTETLAKQEDAEEQWGNCDSCGTPLVYNAPYTYLGRNIVQLDWSARRGSGVMTVIQADPLATLCLLCGNRVDRTWLDRYTVSPW